MSEEISLADGNIREIQRLRGLLAQTEAERDWLKVQNAKLREWLRGEFPLADADIDEALRRFE